MVNLLIDKRVIENTVQQCVQISMIEFGAASLIDLEHIMRLKIKPLAVAGYRLHICRLILQLTQGHIHKAQRHQQLIAGIL